MFVKAGQAQSACAAGWRSPCDGRARWADLVHPASVGAQPGILAPFDDPSAPRAHLTRGLGLIRLRIEVRGLLVFAFALGDLSLGRLLLIFRQDALGPFLETVGPLPDELFLAVLGHHDHRPPMGSAIHRTLARHLESVTESAAGHRRACPEDAADPRRLPAAALPRPAR